MANELFVPYAIPGRTVKFLLVSPDMTHAWTNAGPPALVTYNPANLGTYAIAGTYNALAQGYFADLTAIPAGTYLSIFAKDQAGGSLVESDTTIGSQTNQAWNGAALASPSDVTSSGGILVSATSGRVVSATSTGVVLDPADRLVLAGSNLANYTLRLVGKATHGVITDSGTTATRVVSGWVNGPTPSPGDPYVLELSPTATVGPVTLAPNGLDAVVVEQGINMRQAISPILAAAGGLISGAVLGQSSNVVIKGGNTNTTRIAGTTDAAGNRTSVTLTLPT